MNSEPSDPTLRAFVDVDPDSHFPLQNLPYGVFSTEGTAPRVGVAIGQYVLDLARLDEAGLLAGTRSGGENVFARPTLNAFLALGCDAWSRVRRRLTELLRHDNPELRDRSTLLAEALVPRQRVTMHMPLAVPGYTDFYSSKEHATNVGLMFRDRKTALLPNWLEMPVAYNGRASSVVPSGVPVRRPSGQTKPPGSERPVFGPSRKLDFELEMAAVVGRGNALGEPIPVADAERHIFGLVLLNDWSARDIQHWEYAPLGPFNAKTFATSISPWVVTLEALAPFRVAGPPQEPEPLPYLRRRGERTFDIRLEVSLRPAGAPAATTIVRSNFKYLYWDIAQQLAHHTVSGCNTQAGDLIGSGTISGPDPGSFGSLLELSWNGERPLVLNGGAERTFLEDGDEVVLTGWCQGSGYRIGFGELRACIVPAHTQASFAENVVGTYNDG